MSITRCCKYLGFPIASKVFSKVAFPCLKDFFFYCMLNLQYSLSKNSTLIEKPPIKNPGSSLLLSDQVSPVHPGFSSVQFSHSVMSDSLRPCELQPARPLCPSPTPGTYPNSCPLSWWCHPTISSSVIPFSSCPQSFPASGSFPVSQLFASGGQSIGDLASTSVPPMDTQDPSPLRWTGWISLQSSPWFTCFHMVIQDIAHLHLSRLISHLIL